MNVAYRQFVVTLLILLASCVSKLFDVTSCLFFKGLSKLSYDCQRLQVDEG